MQPLLAGASQFCKSALIPQPLLRASFGLLPKWEKGSRSQSPSPALGEGFRVRAAKLGCTLAGLVAGVLLLKLRTVFRTTGVERNAGFLVGDRNPPLPMLAKIPQSISKDRRQRSGYL